MNTVQCTCSSYSAIEEGLEVIQTRGDYCCIKKVHNSSHNFFVLFAATASSPVYYISKL